MAEETYARLAAPFPQTFKKPGANLDYITGEQVTTRLNEVLGWDGWSFEVREHGYNEAADELWVLGWLMIQHGDQVVIKQQFGSQKPNRYARDKTIIDLGFDLKGAATDALKKCASLIGVGLYLHEKDAPAQPTVNQNGSSTGARPAVQNKASAPAPKPTFWEVIDQMGINRDTVIVASQQMFSNKEPNQLSKEDKGRLLIAVQQKAKENAA